MVSKHFICTCCITLLVGLFAKPISSKSIREFDDTISKEREANTGVGKQEEVEVHEEGESTGSPPATTRRPLNPIQIILQGAIKAPSEIATRVQAVLDGILRVSSSTSPPNRPIPGFPTSGSGITPPHPYIYKVNYEFDV